MDTATLEGNWNQLKGKVRQKWGEITEDELEQAAGNKDELVGLIQKKYGKAKDEAERDVQEWLDTL